MSGTRGHKTVISSKRSTIKPVEGGYLLERGSRQPWNQCVFLLIIINLTVGAFCMPVRKSEPSEASDEQVQIVRVIVTSSSSSSSSIKGEDSGGTQKTYRTPLKNDTTNGEKGSRNTRDRIEYFQKLLKPHDLGSQISPDSFRLKSKQAIEIDENVQNCAPSQAERVSSPRRIDDSVHEYSPQSLQDARNVSNILAARTERAPTQDIFSIFYNSFTQQGSAKKLGSLERQNEFTGRSTSTQPDVSPSQSVLIHNKVPFEEITTLTTARTPASTSRITGTSKSEGDSWLRNENVWSRSADIWEEPRDRISWTGRRQKSWTKPGRGWPRTSTVWPKAQNVWNAPERVWYYPESMPSTPGYANKDPGFASRSLQLDIPERPDLDLSFLDGQMTGIPQSWGRDNSRRVVSPIRKTPTPQTTSTEHSLKGSYGDQSFEVGENLDEPEKHDAADETVIKSEEKMSRNETESDPRNTKFGYVLEGGSAKKYRVEERTPDGYIVGEYGVLNNDNRFVRGVRYTADGTINPTLIHEALMRFLSL